MFWLIYCEVTMQIGIDGNDFNEEQREDWFVTKFNIDKMTNAEQVIATSYFAFTTLATVGFGDLHARSDYERIFLAFIFLFGVLIFSIIMSNF